MARLNQFIAQKADAVKEAADAVQQARNYLQPTLLNGESRTYEPLTVNDERRPSTSSIAQVNAEDILQLLSERMTRLFDITATIDWGNQETHADVVLNGETLLYGVPSTYLLFLEKQLGELEALARRLPVLDPVEEWTWDRALNRFRSREKQTISTTKKNVPITLYPHTDKHPAQTQLVQEDVSVGTWTIHKVSGALEAGRVREILDRIRNLQRAVKVAREEANMLSVDARSVGKLVLDYIFGGLI